MGRAGDISRIIDRNSSKKLYSHLTTWESVINRSKNKMMNSIGFNALTPFEGDEGLYMRSCEINKTNIKELKPYYNTDFDFESNRYFFETLNAGAFTMSYKEFVNKLKSTTN